METATILVYKEVVASMVILVDGKRYYYSMKWVKEINLAS